MFIGDILVAQGLVTAADVTAALDHQRAHGGRLGDNLVALGRVKSEDLETVMHGAPAAPRSIAETGMAASDLLNLVLKTMYTSATETPTLIADVLKLPARIVQQVIEQAQERKLLDVLGSSGIRAMSELRYSLSEKGKQRAIEAMGLNQYIGPAPVSLEAYSERILRQRITNERIDRMSVDKSFSNLVISEKFVRDIGPAINSGRSILLYGPPGNGKTTVSEKIGSIFKDVIYIPYCFEVEGQIIKVFDPGIHKSVLGSADFANKGNVRREDLDGRWVPCRRPNIVTGGELTLSMLDLSFNPLAKFYEAPLHVKALGGIFTIDDFGRQIVTPEALLNRWIVPLESRVDFLQLHTGKNFSLPFDELVIFSTNLSPIDLMDPAFLRRIPYKLEVGAPSRAEYRRIFRIISQAMGMEASDQIIDFVIEELQTKNAFPLASFQPKFIIDQVRAACKFEGVSPQFRPDFITMALANLYTKDTPGYGIVAADGPSAKP